MNTRKKKLVCLILILFIVLIGGCSPADTPEDAIPRIRFASTDFSGVNSIVMRNLHNGKDSYIENAESVQAICEFLKSVSGINGGSSKGYYEGTYQLKLYGSASASLAVLNEEAEIFSIGFGDSDSFCFGEYGDGYPTRFELDGLTIEDVTSFLAQYDDPSNS